MINEKNFKSHLNTVVLAINDLIPLKNKIISDYKNSITDEIAKDSEVYSEYISEVNREKQLLAACIMAAEEEKVKLLVILDKFMESKALDKLMKSTIRDKQTAERFSMALALVDMYAEYLESDSWKGPKLNYDKIQNKLDIRNSLNIDNNSFLDSLLVVNEEHRGFKKLLSNLSKDDMINEILMAYILLQSKQIEVQKVTGYMEEDHNEKEDGSNSN